jgi:hypothetical protein
VFRAAGSLRLALTLRMSTPSMPASIETARISGDNIDAAVALLETVVPPRRSLRRAIKAEGEGFLVTDAGRAMLVVAATAVSGNPQRGDEDAVDGGLQIARLIIVLHSRKAAKTAPPV